jgi:hypothetical protein
MPEPVGFDYSLPNNEFDKEFTVNLPEENSELAQKKDEVDDLVIAVPIATVEQSNYVQKQEMQPSDTPEAMDGVEQQEIQPLDMPETIDDIAVQEIKNSDSQLHEADSKQPLSGYLSNNSSNSSSKDVPIDLNKKTDQKNITIAQHNKKGYLSNNSSNKETPGDMTEEEIADQLSGYDDIKP